MRPEHGPLWAWWSVMQARLGFWQRTEGEGDGCVEAAPEAGVFRPGITEVAGMKAEGGGAEVVTEAADGIFEGPPVGGRHRDDAEAGEDDAEGGVELGGRFTGPPAGAGGGEFGTGRGGEDPVDMWGRGVGTHVSVGEGDAVDGVAGVEVGVGPGAGAAAEVEDDAVTHGRDIKA